MPTIDPEDLHLPYPAEEHLGRVLAGDPIAEAYHWIVGYAENLGESVDKIISLATYQKHVWNDYIIGGMRTSLAGRPINPVFYDKLEILKGTKFERRTQFP